MGTSLQGDVTREKIGNFTEKNADFFPIEKSAAGRGVFFHIFLFFLHCRRYMAGVIS